MISKWEYLHVSVSVGADGGISVFGWKCLHKEDTPSLVDVLNDIGREGWDLVSFYQSQYVFKRPVKD